MSGAMLTFTSFFKTSKEVKEKKQYQTIVS